MDKPTAIEYSELLERKANLEAEISALVQGYISKKTIRGKTYYYLQSRVQKTVSSKYLKENELDEISEQIVLRKQYEKDLLEITAQLKALEQSALQTDMKLSRELMVLKISSGMDALDNEQKAKCISFSDAMVSMEGVPISNQADAELKAWQNGSIDFYSLLERTLQRYGFIAEG